MEINQTMQYIIGGYAIGVTIIFLLAVFIMQSSIKSRDKKIKRNEKELKEFEDKITELKYRHKIEILDFEKNYSSNNSLYNAVDTVNEVTQKLSSINLSQIVDLQGEFKRSEVKTEEESPTKIKIEKPVGTNTLTNHSRELDPELLKEFQILTNESEEDEELKNVKVEKVRNGEINLD